MSKNYNRMQNNNQQAAAHHHWQNNYDQKQRELYNQYQDQHVNDRVEEVKSTSVVWLILSFCSLLFAPLSIVTLVGSIYGLVKGKESKAQYIIALVVSIVILVCWACFLFWFLSSMQYFMGAVSDRAVDIAASSASKVLS